MGAITYSDAIAIAQIVYYSPALLASIFICVRHGFAKASGWFFLILFCLIRIIGASAELSTITNPTSTAITIALVCAIFGTSPLLLSSLGLISRIYYSILENWSFAFQFFIIRAIQIPATIALILCIVGATSVKNPIEIESNTLVHVGIVLFLLVYIIIVALAGVAMCYRKRVPGEEKIILTAVVLALPVIFVKILYAMLLAFSGNSNFSLVGGSKTIQLCMSVLEEMVVVLLYILAGLRVQSTPLPEDASAAQTIGYRAGRGDFQGNRLGLLSLGFASAKAARKGGDKTSRNQQQGTNGQQSYSEV